jgi:hypothetical protein
VLRRGGIQRTAKVEENTLLLDFRVPCRGRTQTQVGHLTSGVPELVGAVTVTSRNPPIDVCPVTLVEIVADTATNAYAVRAAEIVLTDCVIWKFAD